MKYIIVFLYVFVNYSYAQNSFTLLIDNDRDAFVTDVIQTQESDFIITSSITFQGGLGDKATHIYKVDINGQLIDSLVFQEVGKSCVLRKTEQLDNGNFISWGSYETDEEGIYDFWQIIFDEDLNIIADEKSSTEYGSIHYIQTTKNHLGHFVLSATYSSDIDNDMLSDFFLKEITQEGLCIKDTLYTLGGWNYITDIDFNRQSKTYYANTKNNLPNSSLYEIIIFDTNLCVLNRYPVVNTEVWHIGSVNFNSDTTFLFSGNYRPDPDNPYLLGVYCFNDSLQEKAHLYIGNSETRRYSGVFNNLCFGVESDIAFFGSTKNIGNSEWSSEESFLQVDCLDENLNIVWEKFYGGDSYFILMYILGTDDGGFLLLASKYSNGIEGPHERDILLLKADQDGLITSLQDSPDIPIKNAIVLPNPGTDYLELCSGVYPAVFQLYHISGQKLIEQQTTSEQERINTSSLKKATYIWKLIKDGQIVESGKWVKQ